MSRGYPVSRRNRLLDAARRILQHSADNGGQRHCALTFRGSRFISIGFNSYVKTHPAQLAYARTAGMHHRRFLHAELDALLRSGGADTLVVVRLGKNGKIINSKPCGVCDLAIDAYGIKEVIHS